MPLFLSGCKNIISGNSFKLILCLIQLKNILDKSYRNDNATAAAKSIQSNYAVYAIYKRTCKR